MADRQRDSLRLGPLPSRQQVAQRYTALHAKDYLGVQVARVDLPDELTTPPAWREHEQTTVLVPPDGHDPGNSVLAGGHHRRDSSVLSAETGARSRVDANTNVPMPSGGLQRGGNVAEEPVADVVRSQHGLRFLHKIKVHRRKATRERGSRAHLDAVINPSADCGYWSAAVVRFSAARSCLSRRRVPEDPARPLADPDLVSERERP